MKDVYIIWSTSPRFNMPGEDKVKIEGIFKNKDKAVKVLESLSGTIDPKFGLALETWELDG